MSPFIVVFWLIVHTSHESPIVYLPYPDNASCSVAAHQIQTGLDGSMWAQCVSGFTLDSKDKK